MRERHIDREGSNEPWRPNGPASKSVDAKTCLAEPSRRNIFVVKSCNLCRRVCLRGEYLSALSNRYAVWLLQ